MNTLSPALDALADRRMRVMISADLQVQMEPRTSKATLAPMKVILAKARAQAMKALDALIICEASDATTIRTLQNEVRRYDDLVAWVQETIADGIEAGRDIDDEAEQELHRLTQTPEGRQQAEDDFGYTDEGTD